MPSAPARGQARRLSDGGSDSCGVGIGALLIFWSLPNLRGSWHWHDFWDDWWLVPFLGVVCVLNLMLSESESEGEIQSLNIAQKENDDAGLAKPYLHSLFPFKAQTIRPEASW